MIIKTYRPLETIPPQYRNQFQKLHKQDGMMWPSFCNYRYDPFANLIVSTAIINGVPRSWCIIFNRVWRSEEGYEVLGRFIHAYTQKSFRNKKLSTKCIKAAIKLNNKLELETPLPEGAYNFWKKKLNYNP